MYRPACIAGLFVMVCLNLGCTPSNPKPPPSFKVGGTVKLDGKDMNEGEVRFTAPGQPSKSFKIENGAFSGEAFSGKNEIGVVSEVDGGPNPTDPKGERIKVNKISDNFWGAKSKLSTEITADKTDFKFEVTSVPVVVPK